MNKLWSSFRVPKPTNVVDVLQRNVVEAFTQKENVPVEEKRDNLLLKNIKLHITRYFQSTTIQGVQYIGERGRCVLEKLVWTVIIFSVSVMCLGLIRHSYLRWRNSPVIVTFESGKTSISKIPFPAVTLCSETKFNKEILNYTDIFARFMDSKNLTRQEENIQYANLICYEQLKTSVWNDTDTPDIKKKLFDMRPTFTPMSAARVQWLGKTLNANDALFPTFTSEGLCYTFNILPNREVVRYEDAFMGSLHNSINSHKWSPEDGYLAGDDSDAYPRRAFMSGVEGGLAIEGLLTSNSHIDHGCSFFMQGFKVILHHPCEFPDVRKHFRLPLDQAVLVRIKPSLLTVSPELLHYSPKDRKCYFAKEKYLATFKVYTQQNCLDECLSNYTSEKCKCTPFYFPLPSNDSKICGPEQRECARKSKLTYMKMESNTESGKQQCECLPLCTSLSYDVETSQTDWNDQEDHEHLSNYENRSVLKGVHISKLHVYYQDRLFFSYNRKEVYGVADFFSNMGGLFGLFLGLSVTSVIELLYFFTIRIVCNIRKYGRNAWSGEQEPNISAESQKKVPNKIKEGNVIHVASRINETISVAKSPKGSFLRNLNFYVTQYCEKSTIHGVKYIRESDRYILERLIWALIILIFGAACVTSAYYTYLNWKSSPIMVSFATSETSISTIPFPAVTICPEVQFNKDIFNFTDVLVKKRNGSNLTIEEEKYLQYATLVCNNEEVFQISGWNETPDVRKNLAQIHCPAFDIRSKIQWFGQKMTPPEAMVPIFTSEGICYTFNMLRNKEIVKFEDDFTASVQKTPISNKWTYEEGYLSSNKSDVYPYTALMTGLDGGLIIQNLHTNISFTDYLCKGFLQGFKVALHHPYELPNMDKHFRLPLDQVVFSVVKASLINVSPALLSYHPKVRQCYFAKEKYLASYRMYTQQNCLHECLANFTYLRCGCIPFYFPLPHGDIKHCPSASNKCVKESKLKYMEENADSENQPCECLPCCTSLSYSTEISQTNWNPRVLAEVISNHEDAPHVKKFHFSTLNVYYKDLQFLSCERNEVYGTMEFFSHIGGLLGLFLGFSVISAIEIIYFCTLRIFCNIKKYGFAGWFGEPTPCTK